MGKYDYLLEKNKGEGKYNYLLEDKKSGKYDDLLTKYKKQKRTEPTVGGSILRSVVRPVATMVARPIQLGATLAGVETEDIDRFSKEKLRGYVAPVPQSGKDVLKDVGRGVQTVAFGLPVTKGTSLFGTKLPAVAPKIGAGLMSGQKLTPTALKTADVTSKAIGFGAEGAMFGAGQALEEGQSPLSGQGLKTTLTGAGFGAALPVAGAFVGRLAGKGGKKAISGAARQADEVAAPVARETAEQAPVRPVEAPKTPSEAIKPQSGRIVSPEELDKAQSILRKDIPDYEPGPTTDAAQRARFNELKETDFDKLVRIATDPNEKDALNNGYARSWLINYADEVGDTDLIRKLADAQEAIEGEAARTVRASRFKSSGNTADVIRDIRQANQKRINIDEERFTQIVDDLKAKYKKIENSIKDKNPTVEIVNKVINDLIC